MQLRNFSRAALCASTFLLAFVSTVYAQREYVPTTVKTYNRVQTHPDFAAELVLRNVQGSRSMLFDAGGDLLVVARDRNAILAVFQEPIGSGRYQYTTIVSAQGLGINHGLAIHEGYLYASSQDTLYRWPYTPNMRRKITQREETVITSLSQGQRNIGHLTRTIVFSKDGKYLYVSVGSMDNVDPDSSRARVRRFSLPFGSLPIVFSTGEVWADGLRNAVALGLDQSGRLWEVENGADNLQRNDLNMQYEDNPAEELNLLDGPVGKKYGYPWCFSAGNTTRPFMSDPIRGKQYAWPNTGRDDAYCQNPANNQPPLATLYPHSAPLNLAFLHDDSTTNPRIGCGSGPGSFPCTLAGDIFIAMHGSWNSNSAKGYGVARIGFDKSTNMPSTDVLQDIVWSPNFKLNCGSFISTNCFRPAGLAFDSAGTLFVGSQETGDLVRVYYIGGGGNGITVQGQMSQAEVNSVRSVNAESPVLSPTPSRAPIPSPTPVTPVNSGDCVALNNQCGGSAYTGPTCCSQGTCTFVSQWYSQCR